MAILYGLTDQGLVVKSRLIIRDELNAALRLVFGASTDLSDRSILGQIVGILTDRLGELWELLERVASSQDPDKASKTLLDALALITGTLRPGPLSSTVTLTLTGVNTTVVPTATEFATASTGKHFATTQSATLVTIPVWTSLTPYVVGNRVSNLLNAYQCIQAGTSAASGGPIGTTTDVTLDGTCLWTFLGVGLAVADAPAASVDLGAIVAVAKDISQIVTSIGGLQSVTNILAADLGRLEAEDSELRVLRVLELGAAGSSPFDALRGQLLKLSGVTSVVLFANNTDVTNGDGVPPHAVEALVRGGDDQAIFTALLADVAAGIATYGNTVGTATDSQGTAQVVKFSRPVPVTLYLRVFVTVDVTTYPTDGDVQVANAVVAYGAAQSAGRDAVPSAIGARVFRVIGVLDVTQVLIYTDVIASATAWAATTAYVATPGVRSVVTNDGGRSYICITSGTSAGSGGPTGTGSDITDGTVHWYFLGQPIVIASRGIASYTPSTVTVVSTTGTP